jgi:hypothetical protein
MVNKHPIYGTCMKITFFVQLILEIISYVISKDFSLCSLVDQIDIFYQQLCDANDYVPFPPEKWQSFLMLLRLLLMKCGVQVSC